MSEIIDNIQKKDINKEMKEAYLQYSMSVIVGRALPDVRDGLKPVHRRILFAMSELGNTHNKPYKKSARVVGDVIGKYHPHGDTAVYDTMVRMAQDFSLAYPLVDGQGNFGSIDGDSPAAQRYTEVRMTKLAEELLTDIDKETIPFQPNYDDTLELPSVLPAKYPNLLANGSSGIAVGMATNIPPHNLKEVITGCIELIKNPEMGVADLMEYIKGPDFPTCGIIQGTNGINQAFHKGRGIITIKAVSEIIEVKNREQIIVTEIPYQVNKARLIENMANLVRDKKVEGISDIRDESSREGMRIVIFIKKGENAQVILNRLYKYTQMQTSFGIIMLAIDANGQPKLFNLKAMLESFIEHRRDVVTRRCIFELKKAQARAHILEGLTKALDQIDEVIKTIRASKEAKIAKENLIAKFEFTEIQAQAILDMKLQRLTGLEREKIANELKEIMKRIDWLKMVLADVSEIFKIITEELIEVREKYGIERRSQIVVGDEEMEDDEDLISRENMIVSMTSGGYIKRTAPSQYRVQKRGGMGVKGEKMREEDFIWKVFSADTHTTILTFSDRGKVYWVKVYKLPFGSRTAKGKSIKNVVNLSSGENVRAILPVKEFNEDGYVVLLTEGGTIKKCSLTHFAKPRPSGLVALTIEAEDNLISANTSVELSDIFIATKEGMSIRFKESDVRAMGRTARGVRGITLGKNDQVIGMEVFEKNCKDTILIVTENGYGKRTELEEYRVQSRGGVGVITLKTSDKTGLVVAAKKVNSESEIVVTTNQGQTIRMSCDDISVFGRNTQGVRLIKLKSGERVTGVAVLSSSDGEEDDENKEDVLH